VPNFLAGLTKEVYVLHVRFVSIASACILAVTMLVTSRATASASRVVVGSAPAAPSPRYDVGMTYDAAQAEVVLFGGADGYGDFLGDTWTWGGTGWTKQHPATSPPGGFDMGMADDAARSEVVLFGGFQPGHFAGGTWTWDGTTWTKRHPATAPRPRGAMGMTYDAARGEVVLFGGVNENRDFADTWTWDGTTWTREHPATTPLARYGAAMTYDAARGEVVLFGGFTYERWGYRGDTWTWDGSTWTKRHPSASPPARDSARMIYDGARDEVVLFGGNGADGTLGDTWTWDGTTWTEEHAATSLRARSGFGMAYDAARAEGILFGGGTSIRGLGFDLGDTWTWDGTDWRIPFVAHLHLSPRSGPPGTVVQVTGTGFAAYERVTIRFIDSVNGKIVVRVRKSDASGRLEAKFAVPLDATAGVQTITAIGTASHQKAKAMFTVT